MKSIKKQIKYLVFDIDGTLTDGQINFSNNGELFKTYNVKDGYGIKFILPKLKITPIVITGRSMLANRLRLKELNVKYIYENIDDKAKFLLNFVRTKKIDLKNVGFIGDDLPDLEAMKLCKFRFCPNDATKEVKETCSYVSELSGGHGAVRDIIDYISKHI